jgi:hypothetical protein
VWLIRTWIRIGYWIYSLLKITTTTDYNSEGMQAQITATKHSVFNTTGSSWVHWSVLNFLYISELCSHFFWTSIYLRYALILWLQAAGVGHNASNSSVYALPWLQAPTIHTLWRRSPATVVDTCLQLVTSNMSQYYRSPCSHRCDYAEYSLHFRNGRISQEYTSRRPEEECSRTNRK